MSATVAATLQALAEPNRMHIVELLRSGPLTVGEIAEQLNLLQPQTSKHLRALNKAGLVQVQAEANRRIYRLEPEPFVSLQGWLKPYLSMWEERFDNLDVYLQQLQSNEQQAPHHSPKQDKHTPH
ncbi:ArsR/SmtB family transcription factor [Paenibacillus sp. WLX2291]|uniref:ArsR/SmtB family transcription factor n=1 Tax=Paenibacillus sp. WLX2291 TaxID=3296934 RepID=UPI003984382C